MAGPFTVTVIPRTGLKPGTCGHSTWNALSKTDDIFLLSEPDYVAELGVAYDQGEIQQRITIIHELVHLAVHASVIESPNDERHAEERLVKRVTKALSRKAGVSRDRHEDNF